MALTYPQLQNLAVEWGVRDNPAVIVDLVKSSGILQTALVAPSNFGNKHKYKYWNALPSAAFRALGAGIVPSAISKDRAAIDLWDLSSLMQEDAQEIAAHPGGKAGWVAANLGAFLEGMGQAASKQIIYGTNPTFGGTDGFMGLHQYAYSNSNVQSAGTDASATTSIFAVRWDEANGASLRYNGNSDGNLINVVEMNEAPQLAVTNTSTMAQAPVYSWWINAFFTLVVPSAASVAVIKKVNASNCPTVAEMNTLIDQVEANSGRIVIYANKLGRACIESLKDTNLTQYNETMDYNTRLSTWRGVPIILDTNISSAETSDLDTP